MAKKKEETIAEKMAREGLERVAKEQKVFEDILEDLNTNPLYKEHFEKYHPHSVFMFKNNYAKFKANAILYGYLYLKQDEEKTLQYRKQAVDCMWEIQQKKLFTLQCQWRAGLINLEGIIYTDEFDNWGSNIPNCPWISRISLEEINEYIQYLGEVKSKEVFYPDNYQDYQHNTGNLWNWTQWEAKPIPYYAWWYGKHGDEEIHLSDKRGERERYYWGQLAPEQKKRAEEMMAAPGYDARPCLFEQTHFDIFVEKFEDKRLIEFHKLEKEYQHVYSEWDYFDDQVNLLKEAGNDFPIEYHEDWHYAVIQAGLSYMQTMVAKALPIVYDEYLFRIQNGIAPEFPSNCKEKHGWSALEMHKEQIKKGMAILGETGEFDAGDYLYEQSS